MLLFYIRHGDPIYNPDSLTPLGHRQAEAVAKRLSIYGINRIFASTSNRAIQTAKPASEIIKKEITLLDFCNEAYAWDELTITGSNGRRCWLFQDEKFSQMLLSPEIRKLSTEWYNHPSFKDTKFKEGIRRIDKQSDLFLSSLGYEHDRESHLYKAVSPTEDRVALFAHQGFGFAFLSSILDIPYPMLCMHFDMCHSGMTVIEFKEKEGIVIPKTLTVSNDSHLYKEGLPTNYNHMIRF